MSTSDRPAARVVCLDLEGSVLLMHWRDHVSGQDLWEPPGGGLHPGDEPIDAARRELSEETGLPGDVVTDRYVDVARDFTWLGIRYVKTEPFFLARLRSVSPVCTDQSLTLEERQTYLGYGWFAVDELPDSVEPPELAEVIRELM